MCCVLHMEQLGRCRGFFANHFPLRVHEMTDGTVRAAMCGLSLELLSS